MTFILVSLRYKGHYGWVDSLFSYKTLKRSLLSPLHATIWGAPTDCRMIPRLSVLLPIGMWDQLDSALLHFIAAHCCNMLHNEFDISKSWKFIKLSLVTSWEDVTYWSSKDDGFLRLPNKVIRMTREHPWQDNWLKCSIMTSYHYNPSHHRFLVILYYHQSIHLKRKGKR